MIGRILDGRYEVGAKIARGGMATVYEAHDLRLDRPCAVKVMHTDLGDDGDFVARFRREAQSAARLSHPNVVSVSDQGDDHGLLFLVMEHVRGRTLRDVMREEAPMPPARALALLEPVLAALAEAHRCGIVHRDVKPENVLIADDGRVKVADFGLARAFDANTAHTATGGVLIGTVSYLAPELIVNGKADPRSDVYAAGVLLYEMLTGRKPHEGEGAIQIAFKHVNEDVPPPSEATDQPIPAYLDALVARATSRERDHRQADAKVFLQQVRRVRAAVDAGDVDDPDLTADLLPTVLLAPLDSIDYTEETPVVPPVVLPSAALGPQVREQADHEDTSVIEALALAAASRSGVAEPGRAAPLPGPVGVPVSARRRVDSPPAQHGGSRASTPPAFPRPVGAGTPGHPAPEGRGPRRRRPRRGPLLLVLVVALTALVAYAGWWVGVGRYTSAPGVINLSVSDATAKLQDAGLALEVTERQFSETVTAGSVITTDPSAGSRILEGGTVEAVVSRGPERYAVPVLRGKRLAAVEGLLADRNLGLDGVTRVFSETVAKGVVISSDPGAGTELRRDSSVDVTVSKGREPIDIPDFTGKSAARAEQRLTKLEFEVSTSEENSDTVPKGDLISQSPDRGTGFRGDTITLVVSKGPVMVEVPSLSTDSVDAATSELAAVGLKIAIVRTEFYIALDRVVRQSPKSGDVVPKGSTVTVYIV